MTKVRFFITLLAVLMLSVASFAQGDDEELVLVPDDTEGVVVQTGVSGSLEENDDGTYTLTLVGVDAVVPMVIYAPEFTVSNYRTQAFADDWVLANTMLMDDVFSAEAQLQIGIDLGSRTFVDMRIFPVELAFTPATADEPASIQYIVEFDDVDDVSTDEADNDKPEAPETFDDATLTIMLNADVINGLVRANAERSDADRDTGAYCNPYISRCGR